MSNADPAEVRACNGGTLRSARPARLARRGSDEAGASLMFALAFMILVGSIAAALLPAALTSDSASGTLSNVRTVHGGGDGAMAIAINWAKGVEAVGQDPSVTGTIPCVFNAPVGTQVITTTCSAVPGTNSGTPSTAFAPLQPRTVDFISCQRLAASRTTSTATCGSVAGDVVLEKARVRYEVTLDASGAAAANVPQVLSWEQIR